MTLKEYSIKYGIEQVTNDMGEVRHTREGGIVFSNGWVSSIVDSNHPEKKAKYSVAMCDYNGYFDWSILNQCGADGGCFYCDTAEEIIVACEKIRNLN